MIFMKILLFRHSPLAVFLTFLLINVPVTIFNVLIAPVSLKIGK